MAESYFSLLTRFTFHSFVLTLSFNFFNSQMFDFLRIQAKNNDKHLKCFLFCLLLETFELSLSRLHEFATNVVSGVLKLLDYQNNRMSAAAGKFRFE